MPCGFSLYMEKPARLSYLAGGLRHILFYAHYFDRLDLFKHIFGRAQRSEHGAYICFNKYRNIYGQIEKVDKSLQDLQILDSSRYSVNPRRALNLKKQKVRAGKK